MRMGYINKPFISSIPTTIFFHSLYKTIPIWNSLKLNLASLINFLKIQLITSHSTPKKIQSPLMTTTCSTSNPEMDPSKIPLNQISWTEIPCTDLERARSFYEQVFGWTCIPASEMMKQGEKECDSKKDGLVFFSLGSMRGSFILVRDS